MLKNTTLLISSCDKYAACWEPFCHGLKKYWPNHPENFYFITNYKSPPFGKAIKIGADQGWAMNLLIALESIKTPYVLYAQEDYWINSKVNEINLEEYEELLLNDFGDYIRLCPAPIPDIDFPNDSRLGLIAPTAKYRTSLQMALWKKDILRELLLPDESPWDFEVHGSKRSQQYPNRFLSVKKQQDGIGYIFTAIVNGEWTKAAHQYAKDELIQINFSDLPKKPIHKRILSFVKIRLYRIYKKTIRQLNKFRQLLT